MRKKLDFIKAAGICIMFAANGANAASIDDRVDEMEGSLELFEESINDVSNDLENRMRVSGYVDVEYVMEKDSKNPGFRNHHMSIFFQKKISEKWKFFSEIEYEDTPKFDAKDNTNISAAEGKIFVEAVNLDYLWKQEAAFRFGRFFTPAGIWSVDHYPPFVPTQERPGHIRNIFPQLVEGAMAYGSLQFGDHFMTYDAYYVNGSNSPSNRESNEEKALGLKASLILGVPMLSHFELGGSFYMDPKDASASNNDRTSIGLHAKAQYRDIKFQSEAAYAKFDGGDSVMGTITGYYGQIIWEPSAWGIGARHDMYDSNTGSDGEQTTNSIFANYRFNTNLVVKVEHHMINKDDDSDHTKTIISIVSYLE